MGLPSDSRSTTCPPIIPLTVPVAAAISRMMRNLDRIGKPGNIRQHLIAPRHQGISGQNGDRIAEDFVTGREPPSQVVVIQRRQVIMDQGIGVHHFDCGAKVEKNVAVSRQALSRGQHQDGTHALAPGKNRVAHGFVNSRRLFAFRRKQPLQAIIHQFL